MVSSIPLDLTSCDYPIMGNTKFTPDQQKCISSKTKYLIKNEGMKRDQATAIAINKCAPSKQKSMQMHDYSVGRDGYGTIIDVPIMAEVPPGERGNKKRVGRKWMEAAVKKAQIRWDDDGYKAPLHVSHHDMGGKTEAAGFIMPREVREMNYEGKKVWAIFADLEVKEEILDRIQKRELPYRSVEIFSWDKEPEINSLALLEDDVPFFRFPLLTLGNEIGERKKFKTRKPLVAARYSETGSAILFSFTGGMMKEMREEEDVAPEEEAEEVKEDTERQVEKEDEEEIQLEEESESFESKVLGLLDRLANHVGLYDEEETEEPELVEEEEANVAAHDAVPPVEQTEEIEEKEDKEEKVELEESREEADVDEYRKGEKEGERKEKKELQESSSLAKLSGKVAALEAAMAANSRKENLEKLVNDGFKSLEGLTADDSLKGKILKLAEHSKDPKEAVSTFVESFRASVPMTPPATLEEYEAGMSVHDSPAVLKFAQDGPEALEKARAASRQYDELNERGVIHSTREVFIDTTLETNQTGEIRRI